MLGPMADSITLGVDEAGRGAVLGPLVLAACALTPEGEDRLREAGVADSKGFGPPKKAQARRAELAGQVRDEAQWFAITVVPPADVDRAVRRHRLNALERQVAEALLSEAPPARRVVLDGEKLFAPLAARLPGAEALNKAEDRCLAVAAASLLAKTERDRCFAEIRQRYAAEFGPVGGEGYPNVATRRFVEAYLAAHGDLPPETRRSWSWPPIMAVTSPEERGEARGFDFGE